MYSLNINPASFRDPSGFVFKQNAEIYRAIAPYYRKEYDLFIQSGLYENLKQKGLITSHIDSKNILDIEFSDYKVIKPVQIPFISYPYEWCFSQLKSAALLTLKIQKICLKYGMTLKDASAYNIQFIGNKPIFIDTLSFEQYIENTPWVAYKQFCQHFLAPLSLMVYRSVDLIKLHLNYVDGIPLELASSLLPKRAILNSGIASHILLHAKFQKRHGDNKKTTIKNRISKSSFLALIQHLENCIIALKLKTQKSDWEKYTSCNTYSKETTTLKEQTITKWLEHKGRLNTIYDFGCNTGHYSLLAAKFSELVIAMDSDHSCIEQLFLNNKLNEKILPLVFNLSSPSPGIGWANQEHSTINKRGNADILLALALIHHLRISNNVPFSKIAQYFSQICHDLIIEFIPKNDLMVQQMLTSRQDIFFDYTLDNFTNEFEKSFFINEKAILENNGRILFFMTRRKK